MKLIRVYVTYNYNSKEIMKIDYNKLTKKHWLNIIQDENNYKNFLRKLNNSIILIQKINFKIKGSELL